MTGAQEHGPLILGAAGRVGSAWRRLWRDGHWPGLHEPLWQQRSAGDGAICWDLLTGTPPDNARLGAARGVIALAGVTTGPPGALALNTDLARAALRLASRFNLGPVLLCSSAAVYGRAAGPQSETMPCHPANPYGTAKLAMEAAVAGQDAVICLRIANVAGSDQLFDAAARGPVRLDRFADGLGPERAYIGPVTLARTMLALIDLHHLRHTIPPVLNVAAPAPVRMEAVLAAAAVAFNWIPAPETALQSVTLDTQLLDSIAPPGPETATPDTLVAEARAAGWVPA